MRVAHAPPAPTPGPVRDPRLVVCAYDAPSNTMKEFPEAPASGNQHADDAARNAGIALDFYRDVLGRDSFDGNGRKVPVNVFSTAGSSNAYWHSGREHLMVEDGTEFHPLERSLDFMAHELTHGVISHSAKLDGNDEARALSESIGDVMGEAVQIWHEHGAAFGSPDVARGHQWLFAPDAVKPGSRYTTLRDLANPSSSASLAPQPEHMSQYRADDGVHQNAGIPNKAAHLTAVEIGTEKLAQIWYDALTTRLQPDSTFASAAHATIASAKQLYDAPTAQAVEDAWTSVGVLGDPANSVHLLTASS